MATTITAGNATNGAAISSDNTGILQLRTGTGAGTTALTLDASQNATLAGTLAASSFNTQSTFGYKNRIMNGNMAIAQRATSATVTAGTTVPTASTGYPAVDRFFVYCTGANVTAARVAGAGAIQYRMQITGAASVTAVGVGQRIEQLNSYDLAGSTCTLSVDLANSVLTTVTWTASYANTADTFGTIGTPTKTQIATGTFTVNSTVTNYSTQISVPAAATTGIEILFTVGAQTSGTWTIGNVQFEKGSIATSFDYRDYGTELVRCQRYFEKQTGRVVSNLPGTTSIAYSAYPFKVEKRATPTISGGNSGTYTTDSLTISLFGVSGTASFSSIDSVSISSEL